MSEVRSGYKQTEAGIIPNDWDCTTLGRVVSLRRGHDLTERQRRPGFVPVVGSAGHNGFHDTAIATAPGVVLGRSGASFGQAHYCESNYWPHNTALYVTDFYENDPKFIFYLLRHYDFSNHNSGGAQQSLNRNFIAPLPIGIPHPNEQHAIAKALSDADGLIAALETLIAKKRDIKQGAMQELLTGHRRLPGFQGKWMKRLLGSSIAIRNEKVQTLENPTAKVCIELEQMQGATSTIDRFEDASNRSSIKYKFLPNDVLFGRLRPYLRKYWIADREGVCSTEIWPLVAPRGEIDQRFLFCIVQTDNFIEAASAAYGTHMPRADWKMIEQFVIQLPPTSAEQRAIAGVLSDMDAEIAALEGKLAKACAVKQGMMQVLLTGEVRLL